MKTDLGRVVPIDKGEYNGNARYELNHIVHYNGSLYWHYAAEASVGAAPTDTSVWRCIVDASAIGRAENAASAASASAASAAESAAAAQVQAGMAYKITATASGMVDHDIGYVYVGNEDGYVNGNWYYWNGEAWTLGGRSVDPTLLVAGAPADAKATGDAIRELRRDVNTLNEGGLDIKDEIIQQDIEDWLYGHPEATTTVQDSSLSYRKLIAGTLGFVTPEMYGAVGDGVTDDATAFQNAVASDYNLIVPKKTYRLTRPVFCDEARFLSNSGTFPSGKLVVSKNFKTLLPQTMCIEHALSSVGFYWCGGCCYNPDKNVITVLSYNDNKIGEFDADTYEHIQTVTVDHDLGHMNDITYNTNNQKYYIAPMANDGEIIELNDDLDYVRTITLSWADFAPSMVSYDAEADIYYVGYSAKTYAVGSDWSLIKLIADDYDAATVERYNATNVYSQGSAVTNGVFSQVLWILNNSQGKSFGRIVRYNCLDGKVKDTRDVELTYNGEEIEGVCQIGDRLVACGARYGRLIIRVYSLSYDVSAFKAYHFDRIVATRIENNYVNNFSERLRSYVIDNVAYIMLNLEINNALPSTAGEVTVANLNLYPITVLGLTVASEKNDGVVHITIKENGDVSIQNEGGSNPSAGIRGWFRTWQTVPISRTYTGPTTSAATNGGTE